MDRELELAGGASIGGWMRWRKHQALPVGTPCPNCSTPLAGPYCHECGQLGEQFHRSLLHLVTEAVENFFHVDGRLFHTLPRLVLKPGRLTADYIAGHRASQIPPLRLFLVVMLIFFFVGGLQKTNYNVREPDRAAVIHAPGVNIVARPPPSTSPKAAPAKPAKPGKPSIFKTWLEPRIKYAAAHPREFSMVFESWTHRIAIAMLPVAAAILSLLFVFRRNLYVFDHVIFSMHSLSFMGLLGSAQAIVGAIPGLSSLSDLVLLAAPVHLFIHMRGVYGTGVFGTLWRMAALFVLSMAALIVLLVGVVAIGLSEMDATSSAKEAGAPVSSYINLD